MAEHNGIRDLINIEDANDKGTRVNLIRTTLQDVTDIVEANRLRRQGYDIAGLGEGLFRPEDNMTHRASIPLVVAEEWKNKYGFDLMALNMNDAYNKARLAELMNMTEYRFAITYGETF